jgi:hypothetical protein
MESGHEMAKTGGRSSAPAREQAPGGIYRLVRSGILSGSTPREAVIDAQCMRIVNENEYYLKVKALKYFVVVSHLDNSRSW